MTNSSKEAKVIVVGAGPVGLSAALALRSLNLPVTLLEAESSSRIRPGSRALYLHRESLQLLAKANQDLVRELCEFGIVWQVRRTFYRGREVFSRSYSPLSNNHSPPHISLRQIDTENFLLNACKKAGVEIIWDAKVINVRSYADKVILFTQNGESWKADYIIGADGAHSMVRKSLDINMNGNRSPGFHVVVDIKQDPLDPIPNERIFHYEHLPLGKRNVLIVPFAGGVQIDLQCKENDNPDDFANEQSVRSWLPKVISPKYIKDILWISKYRFYLLVANSFVDQHHRALLVGEAAHLFAPFGARGMNSGIADAFAATHAIAGALASSNSFLKDQQIERFAILRRQAAEYNRKAVSASLTHLHPGFFGRLKRLFAAKLASKISWFGLWLERAPYGPTRGPLSNSDGKY